MHLNSLPIGVFDSGVGGLTVLKQLKKILPNESFIYVGDLARLPYGKKSNEAILEYTKNACNFLISEGVKCIVIACNTAASISLHFFESQKLDIPIIGVVKPGAETAAVSTVNKNVTVLATEATIRSGIYVEQILKIDPLINIQSISCPLLVSLAEEGWANDYITQETIKRYLEPVLSSKINSKTPDCILLGCTHFPILLEDFHTILPSSMKIVCSAESTAQSVKSILKKMNLQSSETKNVPSNRFIVTDNEIRFSKIAKIFINKTIKSHDIKRIKLGT